MQKAKLLPYSKYCLITKTLWKQIIKQDFEHEGRRQWNEQRNVAKTQALGKLLYVIKRVQKYRSRHCREGLRTRESAARPRHYDEQMLNMNEGSFCTFICLYQILLFPLSMTPPLVKSLRTCRRHKEWVKQVTGREAVFIQKDEERAVLGCSVPIVSCELVLFDNGSSAVVGMSDRCTLTW